MTVKNANGPAQAKVAICRTKQKTMPPANEAEA